jgi:hypothetical protein
MSPLQAAAPQAIATKVIRVKVSRMASSDIGSQGSQLDPLATIGR